MLKHLKKLFKKKKDVNIKDMEMIQEWEMDLPLRIEG